MSASSTQWQGWTTVPDGAWDRVLFFADAAWEAVRGHAAVFAVAVVSTAFAALAVALMDGLLGLAGGLLAIPAAIAVVACDVALLRLGLAVYDGRREPLRAAVAAVGERFLAVVAWALLPACAALAVLAVLGPAAFGVACLLWIVATPFALPVIAAEGAGPAAALAGGLAVLRARPVEALLGLVCAYLVTAVAMIPAGLVESVARGATGGAERALRLLVVALLLAGIGTGRAFGKLYALAVVRHERLGARTFA
jgi:hypothetical protein